MTVIICGLMCLWYGRGWTHFRKLMLMKLVRSQPLFGNGFISACSTGTSFVIHCNVILTDHLPRITGKRAERDLATQPNPSTLNFKDINLDCP